jgi:hypothetical protein
VLFLRDTGAVTIEFRSHGWRVRSMDGSVVASEPPSP